MSRSIQRFEDLEVWQASYRLSLLIYSITSKFPKEELFGLTSQLRRASVSIPSNIAEGWGRNSPGDFSRFIQIAVGSLREVQTLLMLARDLHMCEFEAAKDALGQCDTIGAMLYRLGESVRIKQSGR